MIRHGPLALLVLFSGCIDFNAARAEYCVQNPAACGGTGDGGMRIDAGAADAGLEADSGVADAGEPDAGTTDGGMPLGALREVTSAGGRMGAGTLSLDVQLGHPTSRTQMTGGTLSLTGAAAVQR